MLNFVICDDNENSLSKFSKMLNLVFENNNLDGQILLSTPNAYDALNFIAKNTIDVVILDIDLQADISGLDLAQKIRKINKNAYIIFATAHLEYLIMAYKCKTFDYLPKPITLNNLESTIIRLYNDVKIAEKQTSYIKINNKDTLLNADLVYFIQKDNSRLIFKTATTEYSTYSSFNKVQPNLPSNFMRCHKSYIVNMTNIEKIDKDTIFFDSTNVLKCYIGHFYKKNFWEVFNNEFNGIFNDEQSVI